MSEAAARSGASWLGSGSGFGLGLTLTLTLALALALTLTLTLTLTPNPNPSPHHVAALLGGPDQEGGGSDREQVAQRVLG